MVNSATNSIQQIIVVLLIISFAFYVQELSTSNVLQLVLPEWPFVFMLYFAVSTRYYFSVISAFFIGLLQDVFLGTPTLGLHAGIYALCAFIIIASRVHFKHLSLVSQSMAIGLLVLFKVTIVTIYSAIFYSTPNHFWNMLSIPFSSLLWPCIYLFFQLFADRRHQ